MADKRHHDEDQDQLSPTYNTAMHAVCSNASLSSMASPGKLLLRIGEMDVKTKELTLEATILEGTAEGLLAALDQQPSPVFGPGSEYPSLHRNERENATREEMEKIRESVEKVSKGYLELVKGSLGVRGMVNPMDRETSRELNGVERRIGGLRGKLEGLERMVGI